MGVVFINIDCHATPRAEYLRPTRDRIAAFRRTLLRESDLSYAHYFDGNWKRALEGGVGDYHTPWVQRLPRLSHYAETRCSSSGASSRRSSLAQSSADATLH